MSLFKWLEPLEKGHLFQISLYIIITILIQHFARLFDNLSRPKVQAQKHSLLLLDTITRHHLKISIAEMPKLQQPELGKNI